MPWDALCKLNFSASFYFESAYFIDLFAVTYKLLDLIRGVRLGYGLQTFYYAKSFFIRIEYRNGDTSGKSIPHAVN